MTLNVTRVDAWAAPLEDKPGSLATKLATLTEAGLNLEFIIARRAPDNPGAGVVFVTAIHGARGARAARDAGFLKTESLHAVRIEGPDTPGRGHQLVQVLAAEGLNLRGFSAAAINGRFVAHLAFDSGRDATKAARLMRRL